MTTDEPDAASAEFPRRRRPRYRGTHPRRFEQRYKELDPQTFPQMQDHVRAQGRTPAGTHVPILCAEVMETLAPQPGDVVVDGTLGYGGHAGAFLERIGPEGRLIGLDLDARQLQRTAERWRLEPTEAAMPVSGRSGLWRPLPHVCFRHMHFAGVGKALAAEGLEGCDVLFADLGASSMQLDDPTRGFSYQHDGPLDMRMNGQGRQTAADLLQTLTAEELAAALRGLGDEPDHAAIARGIIRLREHAPIRRTPELVRLIFEAKRIDFKTWRKNRQEGDTTLHPAARTFQSLRILVNDELRGLEQLLRVAPYCLRPGGRVGLLSFHSGEHDRIARAFQAGRDAGVYEVACPSPIRPGAAEKASNPRSRSALFQWARRGAG